MSPSLIPFAHALLQVCLLPQIVNESCELEDGRQHEKVLKGHTDQQKEQLCHRNNSDDIDRACLSPCELL